MNRKIFAIAIVAIGVLGSGTLSAQEIVHDAEYYILEAQNGERWAVEDRELDDKLAEQDAALQGEQGALLWAVSASDGNKLAELALDTLPVFDGMAAAGRAALVVPLAVVVLELSTLRQRRAREPEQDDDQPREPHRSLPSARAPSGRPIPSATAGHASSRM